MPANFNIPIGTRFGKLIVIGPADAGARGRLRWRCLCDCGREKIVLGASLRSGCTRSCGCLVKVKTHGMSNTTEYVIWEGIKARCFNPNQRTFQAYGGRGITLAPEWLDFQVFYEYMGPRPSNKHSIDRIDNERGYEPGNVRWATPSQQARNKRTTHMVTARGETLCVAEWAVRLGVHKNRLYTRLLRGWTDEDTIAIPFDRSRIGRRSNKVPTQDARPDSLGAMSK